MSHPHRAQVTEILRSISDGDAQAPDAHELLPLVYDQLRRLAASYLQRERPDHTLQPTALVHEAFLKMVDQDRVSWNGSTHFFAVSAQAMRRLLVDHARHRARDKRGGDLQRVTLHEAVKAVGPGPLSPEDMIALDEALTELAKLDARQAKVVELRFFAGMTVDEVAAAAGVSKRTAEGDLTHAMAWLRRRLGAPVPEAKR